MRILLSFLFLLVGCGDASRAGDTAPDQLDPGPSTTEGVLDGDPSTWPAPPASCVPMRIVCPAGTDRVDAWHAFTPPAAHHWRYRTPDEGAPDEAGDWALIWEFCDDEILADDEQLEELVGYVNVYSRTGETQSALYRPDGTSVIVTCAPGSDEASRTCADETGAGGPC